MEARIPPEQYPWWVKLGRFGARSRSSQVFWMWASIALGILLLVLGLVLVIEGHPLVVLVARAGILMLGAWALVAAFLYRAVINWVDRHGTWG